MTCSMSGAGPRPRARLMPPGVHYHGIDIAIPEPAPNLLEADIIEEPVGFGGKTFDVVVAQGLFEYERSYPGSHNWNQSQPGRTVMKVSQARLAVNVPVVSPILAVDYLYVCTAR